MKDLRLLENEGTAQRPWLLGILKAGPVLETWWWLLFWRWKQDSRWMSAHCYHQQQLSQHEGKLRAIGSVDGITGAGWQQHWYSNQSDVLMTKKGHWYIWLAPWSPSLSLSAGWRSYQSLQEELRYNIVILIIHLKLNICLHETNHSSYAEEEEKVITDL